MVTKSIISLGALALLACSAEEGSVTINVPVPATDDLSETKPPTTSQAANAGDTTDATDEAPSVASDWPATTFVPLLDWSFESASPDCNGWPVSGSDAAIRAIPAKTGSYSCKVCSNGASEISVSRKIGKVAKGNYSLSAYVRKRAQTAAPGQAIARIEGKSIVTSEPVAVREEWVRLQTNIQLDEDSDDLTVSIGSANAAADNCLFVDDVVFVRSY